jgi:hypothetical protein
VRTGCARYYPHYPYCPYLLPGNPTSWSHSSELRVDRHSPQSDTPTDSRDNIYSETKGAIASGVHDLDRKLANGEASTEIVQQIDAIVADMGSKAKLPPTYKRKNWNIITDVFNMAETTFTLAKIVR